MPFFLSSACYACRRDASRPATQPKYEKAALRWLERYLAEGPPRLRHFAEVMADLARREHAAGGQD